MKKQGKFILLSLAEFDQWLKDNNYKRKVTNIQNHHTYKPGYKEFNANHFKLVEGMESYQIKERGFAQIAQNITTFPDGTIMLCREFDIAPAGIKGVNANGICIEHVGNFDIGGDTPTPEHKKTIIGVNALLCREFNLQISTNSILYHHWFDLNTGKRTNGKGTTKSCPGTNWFAGNTVEAAEKNFIPLIKEYKV